MNRKKKIFGFFGVCLIVGTLLTFSTFAMCEHSDSSKTYTVISEPTCTESGLELSVCNECGEEWELEGDDPLGHSWNSGVVTTAATCTRNGVKTYTCTRCDDTYTETIAATGVHTYVGGVCEDCGASDPSYDSGDSSSNGSICDHMSDGNTFNTEGVCIICGFECPHYVLSSLGSVTEALHSGLCYYCQNQVTDTHDYDENGICYVCNYTKEASSGSSGDGDSSENDGNHVHNITLYQKYNSKVHYAICVDCGEKLLMDHSDENEDGICNLCGYDTDVSDESEETDNLDQTDDESDAGNEIDLRRLLGAVLGIALIGGLCYGAYSFFKPQPRKKRSGNRSRYKGKKYSSYRKGRRR